jgi:hypothetical protein
MTFDEVAQIEWTRVALLRAVGISFSDQDAGRWPCGAEVGGGGCEHNGLADSRCSRRYFDNQMDAILERFPRPTP